MTQPIIENLRECICNTKQVSLFSQVITYRILVVLLIGGNLLPDLLKRQIIWLHYKSNLKV